MGSMDWRCEEAQRVLGGPSGGTHRKRLDWYSYVFVDTVIVQKAMVYNYGVDKEAKWRVRTGKTLRQVRIVKSTVGIAGHCKGGE